MPKKPRKKRSDAGKKKPAALSFEEKRAKWKADVQERLKMNVTLTDSATGADYPEPIALDKADNGSRNDYVKDRLSGAAVIMLERRLKRLEEVPFDSSEARKLEADILDRAGFTRKPQQAIVSTGPVLFIGDMDEARKVYQAKTVEASAAKSENPLRFPSIIGGSADGTEEQAAEGRSEDGVRTGDAADSASGQPGGEGTADRVAGGSGSDLDGSLDS